MASDLSYAPTSHLAADNQSAVSWGAVIAGAAAALSVSLTLTALAAGFGITIAPWLASKDSLGAFTPILGACMITVQVLSAGLGGYLAGRLRTKWLNVHDHEVHFRDTAHGLLTWAIATVSGVVLAGVVLRSPGSDIIVTTHAIAASAALTAVDPAALQQAAQRAVDIAAQASFFMGVGMLLSAFIAAVAAAIGGGRRDEMHGKV